MIQLINLNKTYRSKTKIQVEALKNISLTLPDKGFVFILGKSGSGKSTLLNILGGLDSFDSGDINFDGISYASLKPQELDKVRNTLIGFVFQSYNILPDLTVGKNISLADELQGKKMSDEKLKQVLESLDLKDLAGRKPSELSGGQLQRVAIARALIKDCRLLLADEPTGALDFVTGKMIFNVLKEASKNRLVLCVSHNEDLAREYADRIITIADGNITSDYLLDNDSSEINYSENIRITKNQIFIKQDSIISIEELKNIQNKAETIKNNKQKEEKKLPCGENSKPKLISSSLSFKNAFLLALSSLKVKPFRFIIAVLLSFISFTLFGLSIVMADYDDRTATCQSISNVVDYVSIKKSNIVNIGNNKGTRLTALSEQDLINLSKEIDVDLTGVYKDNLTLDFTSNIYDKDKIEKNYYSDNLTGLTFITKEKLNELNYTLYGSLPVSQNDITITKYLYDHFSAGGYYDNTNDTYLLANEITMENILGKTLRLDDIDYVITGIVDTKINLDRYGYLVNGEGEAETFSYSEFRTLKLNSYLDVGFISKDKMNSLLQEKNEKEPDIKKYGSLSGEYQALVNGKTETYTIEFTSIKNDIKDLDIIGSQTLTTDSIIINWYDYFQYLNNINVLKNKVINETFNNKIYTNLQSLFEELSKEEFRTYAYKYANDLFSINRGFKLSMSFFSTYINQMSMSTLNDVNVTGIYFNDDETNFGISTYLYQEVTSRLGGLYDFALGKMPKEKESIDKVIGLNYENDNKVIYTVTNEITDTVSSLTGLISKLVNVFKYVGIGFAVFAILMLYNFLSTSIYYKHKDIGILRAIGARKQNIFMIFFDESIILACINAILACVSLGAFAIYINMSIRNTYNILLNVLNVNILHILIIFALSILASFIASFLPIVKITKAMPLETLKD